MKSTQELAVIGTLALNENQQLKVRVQNLCCAKEADLIKSNLQDVEGISKVTINVIGRIAYIIHDPSIISAVDILERLNALHLGVSILENGVHAPNGNSKAKWKLIWKCVNIGIMSVIFLVVVIVGFNSKVGKWMAIPMVILGVIPLVWKLVIDFRRRVFVGVNLLMLLSVIGTLALNEFLDSFIILYVFSIAELLEDGCRYKVEQDIAGLMHTVPDTAILAETNKSAPVEEVKIGTLIIVCAGERIPLDGDVIKGKASVDESSITGESIPVLKTVGNSVYSGTILQNGYIQVKTTCDYTSSTVSRVKSLVEEAQSQTSKTAELINKFTKYYSPAILFVSFMIFLVTFILYERKDIDWKTFHQWIIRVVIILLIACPCSLIMATPIPMICGITNAAKVGAIVKGAMYLERLAQINTVVFDKTGTLTEGRFQVVQEYFTTTDITDDIIELAAALETKSTHPLASCVVNYYCGCIAETLKLNDGHIGLPEVTQFKNESGMGLSGTVCNKHVLVGSEKLMRHYNVPIEEKLLKSTNVWSVNGATLIFIAIDGTLSCVLGLADKCRNSSTEAVSAIQKLDIDCLMLTGDTSGPAQTIAKQVGLNTFISDMKPNDKYNWILQKKNEKSLRVIAMVGDGINDCPSLALADVGIAIGPSAAALAVESADVSLMSDNLLKISHLIYLSKYCRKIVLQNIVLAVGVKLVFAFAALLYKNSLWLAVFADVIGLGLVSFNGLRPLRWKPKKQKKDIEKFS